MTAEILDGIPDSEYHQWRSLSASGAKLLLQEGGPAKYRWAMDHPPEPKAAFDEGHHVHGLVLGVGAEVVEIEADSWRAKSTNERAALVRSDGRIPLLTKEFRRGRDMADAVKAHPTAARILEQGIAEQSICWTDAETGVELRCRPDWLRTGLCVDLKTAADASPHGFSSAAAKYGYDLQAEFYRDGVRQATGEDVAFCFIAVTKDAPHLVGVYELDEEAAAIGYTKYRRAVELFAQCTETGIWFDYGTDIHPISLPKWATYEWSNQ